MLIVRLFLSGWQEWVVALLLVLCAVRIVRSLWRALARPDDGCTDCPCGCGRRVPKRKGMKCSEPMGQAPEAGAPPKC